MNNSSIPPDDGEGNLNPDLGNSEPTSNDAPAHDSIPDNVIRVDEIDVVDDSAPSLSEQWVATEFAARHANTLRYVAPWKKWIVWNGQKWEDDDKRQAHDLADQICIEYARRAGKLSRSIASASFRTAVLSIASDRQQLAATVDQWDQDPWLLNTPGGVVNLKTGVLRNAKPSDMMRMMTSVAPMTTRNDGNNCPLWMDFLHQTFNNDVLLIKYIQLVLGYCLTGVVTEQKMWFGYGSGNNGKGVLLRVARLLMGDYATTTPIATFTVQKFENHPTELARLHTKRLVTSAETEQGRRWAESRIKDITGGDEITARFMKENFFEFLPQFKLFITGNHMPDLRNVGEAMMRRLYRVPFAVKIAPQHVNENLVNELVAKEGPGILLWMVQGCVDWQRDGLKPPDAVKVSTASYFESQDTLGRWKDDCCETGVWAGTTELYESWKQWSEANGEFTGTRQAFSTKLEERGEWKKEPGGPKKNLSGFVGVKLKPSQAAQAHATNGHAGDAVGKQAAEIRAATAAASSDDLPF
jgi:putative DNA primase/helicase